MSKEKEDIDWDKVLQEEGPIPEEIPKEKVLVAFERMRTASRYNKYNYLGAFLALIMILIEAFLAVSAMSPKVWLAVSPLILTQLHYIYLIAVLQRIRTGRTK